MDTQRWFKIRSWHPVKLISSFTSRANIEFTVVTSFCGRSIDFRTDELDQFVKDGFPFNEKTCEPCLRNKERGVV